MSASDDLIGMIAIAAIVLAGWFLIQANSTSQTSDAIDSLRGDYEQLKLSSDLAETLEVTEPTTGLSVGQILAELSTTPQSTVTLSNGEELDLKKKTQQILDSAFGENNYFVKVIAPLKEIRLYFVVDGSKTMAGDFTNVKKIIPNIKSSVEKFIYEKYSIKSGYNIKSKTYILYYDKSMGVTCLAKNPTGIIPIDYSINDKNGNWNGQIAYSDGLWGQQSARLNGSNYISIPNNSFSIGDSNGSAFAWIKTSSNSEGAIFSYGQIYWTWPYGNKARGLFSSPGGKLRFDSDNGSNPINCSTGNLNLQDGKWHHVGYVYSGNGKLVLYADGINYTCTTSNQPLNTQLSAAYIGRWIEGGNNFIGNIQEVSIWSKALNQTEVQALYQSRQLDPNDTNLIAYYKLNEEIGSAFQDETGSECVDIPRDNNIWFGATASTILCKNPEGLYGKYFSNIPAPGNNDVWGTHSTFQSNSSCSNLAKGEYYENWATGSAFASKEDSEGVLSGAMLDDAIVLIFPISDELSSGSEADSCYSNNNITAPQGVIDPMGIRWCKICGQDFANTDNNRFTRSDKFVQNAIDVISQTTNRVFPIRRTSYYVPVPGEAKYCNSDGGKCTDPTGGACYDCCGLPNCLDCVPQPTGLGINSSPLINSKIDEDMNNLAINTGGEVIFNTDNPNSLMQALVKSVDKSMGFELGTKKENEERYVINRLVPSKSGGSAEIKLWVYKNRVPIAVKKINQTNLKPKAVMYLNKSSGNSPLTIKFDATASYDPDGKSLSYKWFIDNALESTDANFEKIFTNPNTTNLTYNVRLCVRDINNADDCTENRTITVQPTQTIATTVKPSLRIIFIPVNWDSYWWYCTYNYGDATAFRNAAEAHTNALKGLSCDSNIEYIIPTTCEIQCLLDVSVNNWSGALTGLNNCLRTLETNNSVSYRDVPYRIIGISKTPPSSTVAGYTCRGCGSMIAYYADPTVTPHEFGHTYSFCDEYSIWAWNNQNNRLDGGINCPNPYPTVCAQADASTPPNFLPVQNPLYLLCNNNGVCEHYTMGNNLRVETAFNCPSDCEKITNCGDGTPANKTIYNCPIEAGATKIDCLGGYWQRGNQNYLSMLGPVLASIQFGPDSSPTRVDMNVTKKYSCDELTYLETKICKNNSYTCPNN
jgi:hypothetical protein